jgi:integrase
MAKVLLTGGKAGSIHRKAAEGELLLDTKTAGFGVVVGKTGRSFVVRFRLRGEDKRYTRRIGDIEEITLADARAEAERIKGMARGGPGRPPRHPDQDLWDAQAAEQAAAEAVAQAAAEAEAEAALSFKVVAERYLDDTLKGGGAKLASNSEYRRKLNKDLAAWHERSIRHLSDADIDQLVSTKAETHGVAANRLLSLITRVFRYAKRRRLIDFNPALEVERPFAEESRDRFLTEAEIKVFWAACNRLPEPAGRLFQLCLVLGQRRGEIAGLRRSELGALPYTDPATGKAVQGRAWLLPAERVKRRRDHAVPLPSLALELIDGAPRRNDEAYDIVLAHGAAGDVPVSGWSKYRRMLDKAIAEELAEAAAEEVDLERHRFEPRFHVHDLRATCATHMSMEPLNVPAHVVSRILNHAEGDHGRSMTGRYIRAAWDAEAFAALEAWSGRIRQIVGLNVEQLPDRERA